MPQLAWKQGCNLNLWEPIPDEVSTLGSHQGHIVKHLHATVIKTVASHKPKFQVCHRDSSQSTSLVTRCLVCTTSGLYKLHKPCFILICCIWESGEIEFTERNHVWISNSKTAHLFPSSWEFLLASRPLISVCRSSYSLWGALHLLWCHLKLRLQVGSSDVGLASSLPVWTAGPARKPSWLKKGEIKPTVYWQLDSCGRRFTNHKAIGIGNHLVHNLWDWKKNSEVKRS